MNCDTTMPQYWGGRYRRIVMVAQISTKGVLHIERYVVADLLYGGITGNPALLQARGINQNANIGVVPFLYALII